MAGLRQGSAAVLHLREDVGRSPKLAAINRA
jgi:hypothetical protein